MRGRLRRLCIGGLYKLLAVKWVTNAVFGTLDSLDPDPVATLNFVVVAQR